MGEIDLLWRNMVEIEMLNYVKILKRILGKELKR